MTQSEHLGANPRPTAKRSRQRAVLLAGSVLLAAWNAPAHAQSAAPASASPAPAPAPDASEIVVTAQRRSQNVQSVPASIVAVTGASLAQRGVTSINTLSTVVSNLQISDPFGAGSPPSFTIRGIASTDFSQNQSRPIAINIDEGIRQLPVFESMPLFDIDHVEVLRGPQGALYGKNATGGAINIITAKPGFNTSGYVQGGFGNFGRFETEGAIQAPLVKDKIALRLAYTVLKDEGTIKNIYPGRRDVEQTDSYGIRGSLLVKPTDGFDFLLRYTHYHSGGRNSGTYAGNIDFVGAGFPELATIPGANREDVGFFQNNQNYTGHRNISDDGLNLQANLRLSDDWKLTSITTYDSGKWFESVDPDGLPIDQERDIDDSHGTRQFVQELRLAGKVGRAQLLFGGFYSHDHTDIFLRYAYFLDPACTVSCSSLALGGLDDGSRGFIQSNSFSQNRDSYSAYGRIEYALTDRLTVAGGVRWSHDDVSVDNYQASYGDIANPDAVQTIAPTSLSKPFENVSGEGVITFKPADRVTTYASFKQGYRTGAINGQAFTSADEITAVQPETADSWEVGVKSQPFGSLLTLNAAGFYSIYHHQHVTSVEQVNGGSIFPLRSVDRSRIYGAEADIVLKPSRTLGFSASIGYTDAVYTNGVIDGESVAGNQLSNAAKWSGNVSADWKAYELPGGAINLHLDAAFQSKVWFDVHNTPNIVDNGHTVANGTLSYDTPKYSITTWVTNLFEARYITYALDTSTEGFNFKVRGNPRQFGLRARYKF